MPSGVRGVGENFPYSILVHNKTGPEGPVDIALLNAD